MVCNVMPMRFLQIIVFVFLNMTYEFSTFSDVTEQDFLRLAEGYVLHPTEKALLFRPSWNEPTIVKPWDQRCLPHNFWLISAQKCFI